MKQDPETATTRRSVRLAVPFSYPVVFTHGLFEPGNETLVNLLPESPGKRHRVFCVLDGGLAAVRPELVARISDYVARHGERLELVGDVLTLPGGEQAKNQPEVLAHLQERLAFHHMDRHSFCVVIGGGAVLDVVGFAAATVHRGVRLVRVPSTVLGQNDAGVGVKNGVNAFGQKNFLGSFAPPFAVINDVTLLATLPPREARAGMAEAVKVALIRDAAFFEWLCASTTALARLDQSALAHLVQRAAELHLDHIEGGGDPFEQGSARPLDFGHWAAHKLERLTHHELRHGEAVAIGIALDSLYSSAAGWLSDEDALRIVKLLVDLGLPIDHPALHRVASDGTWLIAEGLEEFREHLGGELSVTFLHGIGIGETHNTIDEALVRRCAERLRSLAPDRVAVDGGALPSPTRTSNPGPEGLLNQVELA